MKFNSFVRLFGENWRRKVDRAQQGIARVRQVRPALELLEDRTLLAVLPPVQVTGQPFVIPNANASELFDPGPIKYYNTPSIVVDPTNANTLVAVYITRSVHQPGTPSEFSGVADAVSKNGGASWTPGFLSIPPTIPNPNTTNPVLPSLR
jgi:hypothetical protein